MPEPTRWRKKPVEVEAVQVPPYFTEDPRTFFEWADSADRRTGIDMIHAGSRGHVQEVRVRTLEGTMTARPGDWIVKGVAGEVYPVRADIFAATYEPAHELVDWGSNDDYVAPPLRFWETLRWLVLGR